MNHVPPVSGTLGGEVVRTARLINVIYSVAIIRVIFLLDASRTRGKFPALQHDSENVVAGPRETSRCRRNDSTDRV